MDVRGRVSQEGDASFLLFPFPPSPFAGAEGQLHAGSRRFFPLKLPFPMSDAGCKKKTSPSSSFLHWKACFSPVGVKRPQIQEPPSSSPPHAREIVRGGAEYGAHWRAFSLDQTALSLSDFRHSMGRWFRAHCAGESLSPFAESSDALHSFFPFEDSQWENFFR